MAMKRLGTTIRIGFVMTIWSATVLLGLHLFQVFDDGHETILVSRTRLCEAVAVSCSQLALHEDGEGIQVVLESFVKRNDDVLSASFRQSADRGAAISNLTIGQHDDHWGRTRTRYQAADHITVPVYCADEPCGDLEIAFHSPVGAAILGFIRLPSPQVTLLASSLNILVFSIWMGYCFRQSNGSGANPPPFPSAFDTPANDALALEKRRARTPPSPALAAILNHPLDYLQEKPFVAVLEEDDEKIIKTLERLKASQREIEAQNRQLTYLATRDPLTGCLNRRSFVEHFDDLWRSSKRYEHSLSCVMVDLDHFKAINDEHGHQMGDQVIEQVASVLKRTARDTDFVCRYGGEEFCILLPHVDLAGAWFAAERFREAIEALQIEGIIVTASLGCSDREQGAAEAEQLIDQADQALYYSKRNGRNRTTSFDQIPSSTSANSNAPSRNGMAVEPSIF